MIVGVLVLQQRGGGGLDLRDEGALLGRHGLLGGRRPARRRLPMRPQPGGRDVRLIAPEKSNYAIIGRVRSERREEGEQLNQTQSLIP